MIKQTWPSPVKRRAVVSLDHAKPLSFAHSVPSTLSTLVLYSVLCSLCSSHPVNTGSVQCPLLTLFQPPCQHWFCTVSFAHSVPATLSTLVLCSVLCSLCSGQYVHILYNVLWSFCSICTVHTGSIRCPLVNLFHPPSAHRFYTVSFAHCSIRPVHTDLGQCSIITQLQYTHFTL